jgi:hypothetical protein
MTPDRIDRDNYLAVFAVGIIVGFALAFGWAWP